MEEVALGEAVEVVAGEDFERFPKEDEAEIRVLGACAGGGFKRRVEDGAQEALRGVVKLKEPGVSGQAGGVTEEHAEGEGFAAAAAAHANDEARQDVAEARVKTEDAAFVEEHGGCGGGEDLGEAGEVEDGRGGNGVCVRVVGETAEGVEGEDLPLIENAIGCAGECVVRNGLLKDAAGRGETAGPVGGGCGDRDVFGWFHGLYIVHPEGRVLTSGEPGESKRLDERSGRGRCFDRICWS